MKRFVRVLVAAVAVASLLPVSAGARSRPGLEATARARIVRALVARGLDARAFLASPATTTTAAPDGTVRTTTGPLASAIARTFAGLAPRGAGPAGTPNYSVGNFVHVFVDLRAGTGGGYVVKTSSTFPSTPFAAVPSPTGGVLLVSAGGAVRNIRGTWNILGLHTTGTVVGSSVDTGPGAPSPFPVWVPVATSGIVLDRTIDFLGHASYSQTRSCLFGLCITVGGIGLSDGIAIFDNAPIAPLPLFGLPDAP